MLKRPIQLVILLFVVTGCASLTPRQEQGAATARAFLVTAAREYGRPVPYIVIGDHTPGIAATYGRGTVYVATRVLGASWLDQLLAHEVAHWLLEHDAPLRATDRVGIHAEQYRREIAAHVKAVEVLARVRRIPERAALQAMHDYLMSIRQVQDANPRAPIPIGHEPACFEAIDMLKAFGEHRGWAAGLPCSPWASAGQ